MNLQRQYKPSREELEQLRKLKRKRYKIFPSGLRSLCIRRPSNREPAVLVLMEEEVLIHARFQEARLSREESVKALIAFGREDIEGVKELIQRERSARHALQAKG